MKPESIRQFEYFYLAATLLAVVNLVIGFGQSSFALAYLFDWVLDVPVLGLMVSILLQVAFALGILFALIVPVALWYLIARRAHRTARWVALVLGGASAIRLVFVIGLLGWLIATKFPIESWVWYSMMIAVVSDTLHLAALYFLFPEDSQDWFHHGPQGVEHQEVFG